MDMSGLDALKRNMTGFIRNAVTPVDYFAFYSARVITQDSDLTLQLQPDDSRLPGMAKVPIRLGIPNATAQVQAGSRGLVGFENGDPSKPFWGPWDTSTLTLLDIGGTGSQLVALSNLVKNEITALRNTVNAYATAFNTHTHAGVTSGASATSTPASAFVPPAPVGDVAAQTVKVK